MAQKDRVAQQARRPKKKQDIFIVIDEGKLKGVTNPTTIMEEIGVDVEKKAKGGRVGYKYGKSVKKKSSRKAIKGGGCEIR
tara:strand:- start:213 stop:455 length:243 start_codon:yes stop_codon:yes gene_type:complete